MRKIAGESEVGRSETFVSWVLKRCEVYKCLATILFNMEFEEFAEAIREEERVKTKHLQKKAAKKKVTRKVKHDKIVMRDHVRNDMKRHIEYQIKSLRQRNAADCDVVAFINKKFAQIRQVISE